MPAKHVVYEVVAFVIAVSALGYLAYMHDTSKPCDGVWSCAMEIMHEKEYLIRCAISLPVAIVIYLTFAFFAGYVWPREIISEGPRPPMLSWTRFDADLNWSVVGLIAGTPMIQLFHQASDKYGRASGMWMYKDISGASWTESTGWPLECGWLWAVVQIPVYLLLWDFTFYCLHRWVLHLPQLYWWCHSGHHAFRPPTAFSGIAVGPIDVIFEGILPYVVPLFCGLPFHEYTVNAVNVALTLHALILHSSNHHDYSELSGFLGWLMISPVGHNMHHQYGEVNACNFAPIFKIWDRWLGTLNEKEPFWWASDRKAAKTRVLAATALGGSAKSHEAATAKITENFFF